MQTFFASGKIMLTGEYAVLFGAPALAIPTKLGQQMQVTSHPQGLKWKSRDPNGVWFEGEWNTEGKLLSTSNKDVAKRLKHLLDTAQALNPNWQPYAADVLCTLAFPTNWGLGSSSTLIALVAQWAQVDPMTLFFKSWQGSGYDVAVASANTAIVYQKTADNKARWTKINVSPPSPKQWFFVHQNIKQSTYSEINRIAEKELPESLIEDIETINQELLRAQTDDEFEAALQHHERIISTFIGKPMLSEQFAEQQIKAKSLGAWGGDFFLSRLNKHQVKALKTLGYKTIIPWTSFIRSHSSKTT